ncbi:MAG: exodeoxyribonuclease V subunit beta [Balneolaceae bacterium]|nr:exodeoxyribonuclease V subunit beta [Balneolaceae bacterium]
MSNALDVFNLPLSGKFLIEAGAGTGKTYSITSLYVRVLIEKKMMPNQVLVLTFTNDATNELKQRLRKRVQEVLDVYVGKDTQDEFLRTCASKLSIEQYNHLQKCIYAFDEAAVSTIHGFCQRLLSEHAIDFQVSPNFDLLTDELTLLTEATDVFWIDFFFKTTGDSEFERWYKILFEEIYKAPEDFIKKYREILLNPDLEISAYNKPFGDFESTYEKASSALERLKESVERYENELIELFENGPLSGTYYKNKPQMVAEFLSVVKSATAPGLIFNNEQATPNKVEERFVKFGNYIHTHLLKNKTIPHIPLFDKVDEFYALNTALLQIKDPFFYHAVIEIRKRFAELKHKRNLVGYNDLLVRVRDTFKKFPGLATNIMHRYPVAFIDEFQDTDHIQFSIFQQIYDNNSNVLWVMIGDPKQAIYRFRGADINTYLYAKTGVDATNHRTLLHNYRSSKLLIKAVNAFFNYSEQPFGLQGLNFENAIYPLNKPNQINVSSSNEVEFPLTVIEFDQDGRNLSDLKSLIMNSVCSEIITLLNSDYKIDGQSVSTADIAILVDKHEHASELQKKLLNRGIKSIIRGKKSVFETHQADELYRILRAVAEYENERYLRAAMLTECLQYTSEQMLQLFESEDESNQIIQRFSHLNEKWQNEGFSKFINNLFIEFDIEEHLATSDQPERALTNLYHLKELLVREVRDQGHGMQGILRYFQEKRENANTDNDAEIIRLESDGDLIQIVTHHSSKGLEYPIVFCPFLWDMKKSHPDYVVQSDGKSTQVVLKNDSEAFNEVLESYRVEELSEQKRLVYVALTRAQLKCFVYVPTSKTIERTKGNNTIKMLWDDNIAPQLDQINEIERKTLSTVSGLYKNSNNPTKLSIETSTFTRSDLWQYPRVVSYSSLSGDKHSTFEEADFKDLDAVQNSTNEVDTNEDPDPIFAIPKGKNTGNLVHAIFEEIDFDDPTNHSKIIKEKLDAFQIEKKWEPAVNELIHRSLTVKLTDEIRLNEISKAQKLVEMEFFIPIYGLSRTELLRTLGKQNSIETEQIDGFLKGFIDLIFRVGDTYYILDYKTNHLGSNFENYSQDALQEEMKSANYDIQYHLYTLALYRFLETRIPDFNYSKHFGGVFYLFVRGVNPKETGSGVFYDKPEEKLIKELDSLITEVVA